MKITPRDYQEEAATLTVNCLKDKGKGIVVMPVGSGKTLAMGLVALKLGEPILVVAHNQSLVLQNYNASMKLGVEGCAIYCQGLGSKDIGLVTFCTVKSAKANIEEFKKFNYVLVDECDLNFSTDKNSEYNTFFREIGIKSYVGFTGTPLTTHIGMDGSKIKLIHRQRPSNFSKVIYHLPVSHMVKNNYWSNLEYIKYDFNETLLELNSNKTNFTGASVQKAIQELSVNNNAYILLKKMLAKDYKGILVYCSSLDDAAIFKKNIPNSEIISHKTKSKDRERIIEDFRSGKLDVLFNLNTMKSGFDMPGLKWIVIIPALGSIRDYIQICGRGVRKEEGKEKCTIIDFGGNFDRYGDVRDIDIKQDSKGDYQLYSKDILLSSILRHEIGKYKLVDGKIDFTFTEADSKRTYKLKSGKYKGRALCATPFYYLKWMVENMDNCPPEVKMFVRG